MAKAWLFVRYDGGALLPVSEKELPVWLRDAWKEAESPDEMDRHLAIKNIARVQQVGFGDVGLDVWRHGTTWFAQHFSDNVVDANILIEGLPNYLHFLAFWFSPVASAITLSDLAWKAFKDDEQPENTEPLLH